MLKTVEYFIKEENDPDVPTGKELNQDVPKMEAKPIYAQIIEDRGDVTVRIVK